ncbi:hypothetical protein E3T54_12750 [Cryobacterium sp. Sr8]|uniref:hypothetical protein n=1 Tax=Cryobacterium sp. Sr8 TaxID=1259203 RepID=UPI00106A821D|nr:hypothetical protein [Cryobacterium sp. Sr8]TFD75146.1 hypothetical protein E3T54_12750 [Cryobacterium sp. Sr8]
MCVERPEERVDALDVLGMIVLVLVLALRDGGVRHPLAEHIDHVLQPAGCACALRQKRRVDDPREFAHRAFRMVEFLALPGQRHAVGEPALPIGARGSIEHGLNEARHLQKRSQVVLADGASEQSAHDHVRALHLLQAVTE